MSGDDVHEVPGALRIETVRLVLRPLLASDEDDLLVYQSDPEVVRYIPWPPRTREQVRAALAKVSTQTRLEESDDSITLAMLHKQLNRVIGQVNLRITSKSDRQGDFGYVVSPAFARRGFACEASAAILNYGFETLGLHRISAHIDTRNIASAALAVKLGMRREAEFRESEFFKGEWSSAWVYAMLRSEWATFNRLRPTS